MVRSLLDVDYSLTSVMILMSTHSLFTVHSGEQTILIKFGLKYLTGFIVSFFPLLIRFVKTSIMSNGKSKKVASRVFGASVFNDLDTSLCYTPSPRNSKNNMSQTKTNHGIFESIVEEGESTSQPTPVPTVLFQPDSSTDQISVTDHGSKKGVSFILDDKENSNDSENKISSKSLKSIRSAELHRLRASNKKSPMRRNLVKMTEAAIDDATTSLKNSALKPKKFSTNNTSTFQSINAGRTAKTKSYQQKAKAVKSVSFQWDQDKAKSKSLQKVVEENRRQIRAIQRKLTSNHFKDKARRDEAEKMERLAALEKEYLFKSEVFQDHQKTLKFERDKSRKKSMDARAKIRINKIEGEEVMRMRKLEEDTAIFQTRENLHNARREAQKEEAERRRKSLQLRADIARKARDAKSELRENELHENHATHELNRAAARDVDNYKKQLQKESQDDFKKRNKDAHDARNRQQNQACEAMIAEHENYELKWAGEHDAEAYRKQMQDERRKSLASRNKESKRHATVMEELRSIAKEEEAQKFMLKFQGENDAKDYIAKMAEERRKSLQLRGVEAGRRREVEEEQHAKAVEAAFIEGALKSDCKYNTCRCLTLHVQLKFCKCSNVLSIFYFQILQAKKMSKTTKPSVPSDEESLCNIEERRPGYSD